MDTESVSSGDDLWLNIDEIISSYLIHYYKSNIAYNHSIIDFLSKEPGF